MSLADFFPQHIKDYFAKRNIKPGETLLVRIPDFDVSYPKYWIIVAINTEEIAGVVVNTKINKNIFWNDELKKLNLPILQKEHSFLDYDSFIDCSKLNIQPHKEVFKAIVDNPKIVVGNITPTLLKNIHLTIIGAKTISVKHKKKFGFI